MLENIGKFDAVETEFTDASCINFDENQFSAFERKLMDGIEYEISN